MNTSATGVAAVAKRPGRCEFTQGGRRRGMGAKLRAVVLILRPYSGMSEIFPEKFSAKNLINFSLNMKTPATPITNSLPAVEAQLADATQAHTLAVKAHTQALDAEVAGTGSAKSTAMTRDAVTAAIDVLGKVRELVTAAQAKAAASMDARDHEARVKNAAVTRARIQALVKSRAELGAAIDAKANSIVKDYLDLDKQTTELCDLIGRDRTGDLVAQTLAPYRLSALLMQYWGAMGAPWAPRPTDTTRVERFSDVVNDTNAGLLARAQGGH